MRYLRMCCFLMKISLIKIKSLRVVGDRQKGELMSKLCSVLRSSVLRSSVVVSILFFSTVSLTSHAQEIQADGTQWSGWETINKGVVARKKVPPRMDRAVDKRALKSVKSQRSRLLKKRARLRKQLRKVGQKNASQVNLSRFQSQLREVDAQLNAIRSANSAFRALSKSQAGVWLHNDAEGVHAVSVADLAENLGITQKKLVKELRKRNFTLVHGYGAQEEVVPYYYDKKAGQVLYVADSYQTIYTNENAYRVRLSKSKAVVMKVKNGKGRKKDGQASAFADTLYFEQEPDMAFDIGATRADQDADYWFWDYLFGPHKDTITVDLTVPNPALTGNAQLRIVMRGWTDLQEGDDHQVVAELNGQAIGTTLVWDGYAAAQLEIDFDQSLLAGSGDNTLVIRSIYEAGSTPGEYLDKIELDYLRLPVAQNGQLWLHDVSKGTQRVSGFASDDIVVIEQDIGNGKKDKVTFRRDIRVNDDGDGFSVVFNAKAGLDYIVAEQGVVSQPQVSFAEAPTLADGANMGEYLIIAPRDFAGTAEALMRLREVQFGHVKTVWLDQIYAEYSAGRVDPFAISRFMTDIRLNWSVAPTHVVILGNGSLDHKNRMGYDESFVPAMLTVTYELAPWTRASSDDRLLGADGDAEFAIGRVPILSDAEGIAYVEKLNRHSQSTSGSYTGSAVLVADNPDVAGNFHTNSDILSDQLLTSLGFNDTTKLYHPSDSQVRTTLTDSATWDSHSYLSYDGHGTVTQLGDFTENFITVSDAQALSNTQYPVFTALTCAAGEYVFPGVRSLVASMVLNPNGGAIAAMAPTGLSLDADAQYMGSIYTDTLFGSNDESTQATIGEAVQVAKLQSLGEVNDFMTRIYSVVGDPAVQPR